MSSRVNTICDGGPQKSVTISGAQKVLKTSHQKLRAKDKKMKIWMVEMEVQEMKDTACHHFKAEGATFH